MDEGFAPRLRAIGMLAVRGEKAVGNPRTALNYAGWPKRRIAAEREHLSFCTRITPSRPLLLLILLLIVIAYVGWIRANSSDHLHEPSRVGLGEGLGLR